MTKTDWTILGIIILVIAAGAGALAYFSAPAPSGEGAAALPMASSTEGIGDASGPAGESATVTVTYGDSGFNPASISIAAGDTVRFVNNSSHGMWVASDEHPTHTEYDGTNTREHCANGAATSGTFDQCAATEAGSTYSFTFPKAGTFEYHNHARASDAGTIVVK